MIDPGKVQWDDEPAMSISVRGTADRPPIDAGQVQWDEKPSVARGAAMGVVRGAKDVVDTGAELLARGYDAVTGAKESQRVKDMNAAGKRDFQSEYGDSTAAQIGRVGGQIVATAPLTAAAGLGLGAAGLTSLGRAVSTLGAAGGGMPTRIAGGAISGGIMAGAVSPEDAGMGAAIGAAMPPVIAGLGTAAGAVGRAVRPFTAAGRESIVADAIKRAAADPGAVAANLSAPPKSVAPLTFPEVANDPGISALHRLMQNRSEDYAKALAVKEAEQNAARFGKLHDMSSGPNSAQALAAAREQATAPLFDAILSQHGQDMLGTKGVLTAMKEVAASPRYQTGAVRSEVHNIANRFGSPANGFERRVPYTTMHGARQEIDQRMFGGQGLDAKATAKAAAQELGLIRDRISNALNRVPGFKDASVKYAELSKPVDAAETLGDMLKAASTGTRDVMNNPVLSAAQMDRALKGLKPEQWSALSSAQQADIAMLAEELTRAARVKTMGKAVGSNTAQNLMAGESLPISVLTQALTGLAPLGTKTATSGMLNLLTMGAGDKIKGLMGEALLDPAAASRYFSPPPAPILSPNLQGLLGTNARRLAIGVPTGLLADH